MTMPRYLQEGTSSVSDAYGRRVFRLSCGKMDDFAFTSIWAHLVVCAPTLNCIDYSLWQVCFRVVTDDVADDIVRVLLSVGTAWQVVVNVGDVHDEQNWSEHTFLNNSRFDPFPTRYD